MGSFRVIIFLQTSLIWQNNTQEMILVEFICVRGLKFERNNLG